MYSNETINDFLKRVNDRLDQETDAGRFWKDRELIEYLNEGVREVWQTAREAHQNWFVRRMSSQDGVVQISGQGYDTDALKIIQGRDRFVLPPDFNELLMFEPVPTSPTTDGTVPAIVLEYANLTQRIFRQNAFDRVTDSGGIRRYKYDVVFGPDTPYIFVSPPIAFPQNVHTQLAYVAMPVKLRKGNTFEATGLTDLMVDAILAYICFAAVAKHDLSEQYPQMEKNWLKKQELVGRASGPKQTRDEEPVDGYLEEEL